MLRVSANVTKNDIDLHIVMGERNQSNSAIEFAQELMTFAEALVSRNEADLRLARNQLLKVASSAVLVDAAGVAANFQRMVRIATATGIPVDNYDNEVINGVRAELDLYRFKQAVKEV